MRPSRVFKEAHRDGVADTKPQKLALAGTIQFATGVERARVLLAEKNEGVGRAAATAPVGPGEGAGCTVA